MDIKLNGGCTLVNTMADSQGQHHLATHMKPFCHHNFVGKLTRGHMFTKDEVKKAKAKFKKSIGTMQFNLERDKMLRALVEAKTPRWGSLVFKSITNYDTKES